MASYEIEPDLFDKVSRQLVHDVKSRQQEKRKAEELVDESESQPASIGDEAEQGIQARIDQYRQIYHQKMSERALETRKEEENRRRMQQQIKHR